MKFNSDFNKLPPIYTCSKKDCYFDPIRKKLIYITPEETVRQKCLQFLLECDFPKNMITVEEHLSHYNIDSKHRADIIIKGYIDNENITEPIAIIECKAPHIPIDSNACKQVFHYADLLNVDYVAVTNGIDNFYFHYDEKKGYEEITELPSYEDLIKDKYTLLEHGECPDRIPFDKLASNGIQAYGGYDIGENTSPELQAVMINLWECLLDKKYIFPSKQYDIFDVIEDLGIRILTYGDASGGLFSGPYRSFLINYKGSTEIISINISTYCTWTKRDIQKTAINVAIDNDKQSHHSLQLVADDNIHIINDTLKIYHHGRIAVGNIGSGKADELRFFVERDYPKIISGKQYYLGELKNNRLWRMTDADIVNFIENIISYALIRDEYRQYLKSKKQSNKT